MNNILFKVLLLKGENGNSIASIAKTSTSGLKDTYTITLTDGSTTTFEVENGKGISSIAKTATSGLIDTYTITYTDNTTSTFTVTNGADGKGIVSIAKTGTSGLVDTYTITYTDNTTSTFTVTNGEDGTGDLTTDTETGNPIALTTDIFQPARATKITLSPIQASGTPTPSNPLPIYGYDSVDLQACGVNQWDEQTVVGALLSDGTVDTSITTRLTTSFIPVVGGKTYYQASPATAFDGRGVFYDKNKNLLSYLPDWIITPTFTAPAGAGYLRVSFKADYGTTYNHDVSFNYPATDTTYHAYTPATQITHSFPTTIYGGEVDVERGVLTVDRGIVDLGNLAWSYFTDALNVSFFYVLDAGLPTNFKASNNAKCSIYQTEASALVNSSFPLYKMALRDTVHNQNLSVKDDRYANASDFKTAVAGQKLVYELATPIEIQLTPRLVNLLQGANVITSNGTSIEITYRNGTIATLADVGNLNRTIDALATETAGNKSKAVKQTSGTLDAQLKANATAVQTLANEQVRNISAGDTDLTAGTSSLPTGDIYLYFT